MYVMHVAVEENQKKEMHNDCNVTEDKPCDVKFSVRKQNASSTPTFPASPLVAHVSPRLGLGLHSQLVIAAVRCVVQLSLLGYILGPIFDYGEPWLVAAYATFMVWVSAVEAIGRPARFYKVRAACAAQFHLHVSSNSEVL